MFYSTVKVIGNKLPTLGTKLNAELERALDKAVLDAIAAADPNTRRRSSDLVNTKETLEKKGERTLVWLMDYALYQDQGTVHMDGTKFTEFAANAGQKSITKSMQKLRIV